MYEKHLRKRLRCNRRALSPIFATLMLVAVVIVFGTVAYYYASNVTTTATNQYTGDIAQSRQSISERIGFENVIFTQNSPPAPSILTVYVINCGSTNNVQISAILLNIYDINHNLVSTTPYNIATNVHTSAPSSTFVKINDGSKILPLNMREEGYFTIELNPGTSNLVSGYYSIQLITKSGSSFTYAP